MVKIKEVISDAEIFLSKAGVDNPKLDTRLLFESASGMSREELVINYDSVADDESLEKFKCFVDRRCCREPVSRILGEKPFWKHSFVISQETLDPRPDTEVLVESILKNFNKDERLNILDLGTGSGCILISLLNEFINACGVGVDISADAVKTASLNSKNIGVHNRINLINASWDNLVLSDNFDIVVSNPPYIETSEILELEPEVKDYDPVIALDGGHDGMDCYRQITALLPKILKKGGWVFFEIGYNQAQDVKDVLAKGGFFVVETVKDLTGCDRCVVARGGQ